jgi:hypothetical protein
VIVWILNFASLVICFPEFLRIKYKIKIKYKITKYIKINSLSWWKLVLPLTNNVRKNLTQFIL